MNPNPRCSQVTATTTAVLVLLLGLITAESAVIIVEPGGATIQSALDSVEPGDTIDIESGIYFEDLITKVDGTEDARITIQGVGGAENVIIRGTGEESRVFQVQNDYYTIQDFTIDGQAWNHVEYIDEDNAKRAYRDILIYVAVDRDATERSGGYTSALDGLVITRMIIQHALSECVRLRHFVTYAEIYDNIIQDCGLEDFVFSGGGENGEGIYIGTALAQWDEEKNYSGGEDICLGNVVRDNEITTNGNEGVDVKEGCLDTLIENNNISMQRDENAGGISSHADNTVIRGNTIKNADGAGVRVGTTEADETGHFHGINNTVTGNTMTNCYAYGVKIMSDPQGDICGNYVELQAGVAEDTYKYCGGTYGAGYEPFEACNATASATPTPAPSITPGAVYLGCFMDVKFDRTMDFLYSDKTTLTNESCIERCREGGMKFAGTTNAKQCRCTNTVSDVDMHGVSTGCTKKCPLNSVLPCVWYHGADMTHTTTGRRGGTVCAHN